MCLPGETKIANSSLPSLSILNSVNRLFEVGKRKLNELTLSQIQTFHFDIVQGCQLRCIGCPNSTLLPKIDHIDPEQFSICLGNVDVERVSVFRLFNFGEPFLHPDLRGLLEVLKVQKWKPEKVEISTNAMIFDEKKIRDILTSGVVTHLFVSCDGDGTPSEFERLRPPGKWDKLILFLEEVSRIKQELNSSVELKTRNVCMTEDGRARWLSVLRTRGWEPEFREWQILPSTSGEPWERPPHVTNKVCWPMSGVNLFVDCHGDVIPCCSYPDLPPMGNLLTKKFTEIHRGALRSKMLNLLKTDRVNDKICGNCES